MKILEIILIGIGLAMDAFAVSVCKRFIYEKIRLEERNCNCIIFWSFPSDYACNRIFFTDLLVKIS